MNKFMKTLFPKEFWYDRAHFRALVLGVVYAFMLVMQLFTYEDFASVVQTYSLLGGETAVAVFATLIPVLGLASLPYLLSMDIPVRLWKVSRAAALMLPAVWVGIALWTNMRLLPSEAGIFGATLPTISSWWFVIFTALLMFSAVLVACELKPRQIAKTA